MHAAFCQYVDMSVGPQASVVLVKISDRKLRWTLVHLDTRIPLREVTFVLENGVFVKQCRNQHQSWNPGF
jgi:hypothetical protein